MKKLDAIQAQIDKIQEAARQEAEKLRGHLDAANQTQAEATAAFIAAQQAGDPKAYAEAAANHRTSKDIAEMYGDMLKKHQTNPRINGDQYSEMKDQTVAALDEMNTKAKERIMKALEELEAVRDELAPAMDHGLAILNQIERMNAPQAQPKADYNYKGKDGGRLNILTVVNTIMDNEPVKYLKGDN